MRYTSEREAEGAWLAIKLNNRRCMSPKARRGWGVVLTWWWLGFRWRGRRRAMPSDEAVPNVAPSFVQIGLRLLSCPFLSPC